MKWTGLVALACACSGGKSPDHMIVQLVDGPPADMEIVQGPNSVDLSAGTPTFIAYRDGKGPWQTPVTASVGHYTLNVTNDYQFVVVCANGADFDAEFGAATFSDGSRQSTFCGVGAGTPPTTVSVTGTMTQAGEVQMFDTASSATAGWSFNLAVTPGMHDLVADDGGHVLVQRNRSISAATSLGTLDVVANGSAMTAVPLTITGAGSDTLRNDMGWLLANDFAFFTTTTTTLETPPASLVMQNDFRFVFIRATGTNSFRDAFTQFTGTETTFALPPVPTGISFAASNGALTATSTALATYASMQFDLAGAGSASQLQDMVVSGSWVAATGATELAFDTSAPGYDPAWNVNITGPYIREFLVSSSSGGISYSSAIEERQNGALLAPARQTHDVLARYKLERPHP